MEEIYSSETSGILHSFEEDYALHGHFSDNLKFNGSDGRLGEP
jgi:hypothetical protein